MELDDCNYTLLAGVDIYHDYAEAFAGANVIILIEPSQAFGMHVSLRQYRFSIHKNM